MISNRLKIVIKAFCFSMLVSLVYACSSGTNIEQKPEEKKLDKGKPPISRRVKPPESRKPISKCLKGNICLGFSSPELRACDLLFSHDKTFSTKQATFSQEVIGYARTKGERSAFSFVFREDKPLGKEFALSFRLKSGIKAPKLEKTLCYDRMGRVLSSSKANIESP